MVHRFYVFTLSALVVVAAAGGAMVSAQGPGPGGPRGGGSGIGRGGPGGGLPLRELELTDAQREQVQQLTQQRREQTRALFERAQSAREGQRLAMDAMPFNEQQIRAAMPAVLEAETELAVQQARLQSDIYALLTSEQQQRVQKMRADREAGMKERQQRPRQRGTGEPRPQV